MTENTYTIPVPYTVTQDDKTGARTIWFLDVEVPAEHVYEYVKHGEGSLDFDYIVSIRPGSKNCPQVDEKIRSNPKFIDIPWSEVANA